MSRTLAGRLALVALGATALSVGGLTLASTAVLRTELQSQADDLLRARAAAVASTVDIGPDGALTLDEIPDDRYLDVGTWIYSGGRPVEQPRAGADTQGIAAGLAGSSGAFLDAAGRRFYAVGVPGPHHGPTAATVIVSVGLDPYERTANLALFSAIVFAAAVVGASFPVTRAIVARALDPVTRMSAQAARWSQLGAAERFGGGGRPAELASLAANLDELLDRLAAVLRHEQRQTADLWHELRTPLARVVAEADWLAAAPRDEADRAESVAAISQAAAGMQRICDTLLSEERTRNRDPGECVPREVAARLAAAFAGNRPDAPSVTVSGEVTPAGISADVLERILSPLLDNAARYARAAVRVHCARTGSAVEISVVDDGPGVSDGFRDRVFGPGQRADPGDGHDGAGLGLALARRLARAAGGDVTLAVKPAPASKPASAAKATPIVKATSTGDVTSTGDGGLVAGMTAAVEATPGSGATFVVTLPVGGRRPPVASPATDRLSAVP